MVRVRSIFTVGSRKHVVGDYRRGEGGGAGVPVGNEGAEPRVELFDGAEDFAADFLALDDAESNLHHFAFSGCRFCPLGIARQAWRLTCEIHHYYGLDRSPRPGHVVLACLRDLVHGVLES